MGHCPKCERSQAGGSFCPVDGTRLLPEGSSRAICPVDDPMLGQTLSDRYRIVRQLGVGGMGTVYEAEHLFIEKRVAIKLLRPEITESEDAMLRLQREAMAASTIGHKNIVTIDDFGHLPDGRAYLSMECLEGHSLAEMIRQGGLSTSETLRIVKELCDGLSAAHAKGIVHRDIKADNVFLLNDGGVKILDFGIAKAQGNPSLTQTGAIYGTPNYMAPEQALGREIDHRVDIYAVGVLLFEMLTGRVPFIADTFMAILTQHVTEEPPSPTSMAQGREISPALDLFVLRALAKDPRDRFQNTAEMSAELERLPIGQAEHVAGDDRSRTKALGSITHTAGEMRPIASPPQYRRAVLLGVSALLLVGVIAYVLVPGAQEPASTARGATLLPDASADATSLVKQAAVVDAQQGREDAALASLIVGSEPNGATIYGTGSLILGVTPALLKLPASGTMEVRLERKMYLPKTVKLTASGDGKFIVKLKRREKAPERTIALPRSKRTREPDQPERPQKGRQKSHGQTDGKAGKGARADEPLDPY